MKEYIAKEIETKWQRKWKEDKVFKVNDHVEGKENYYVLEMFAYPSGKLHMGHLRNYTIGDAIARYTKMKGYNVLHPFGWDSFGLPAENAAIDNGVNPAIWTAKNIEYMKNQLQMMGLSYDWDREISTFKEQYYKFNQKLFIDMYKMGLVYKKKSYVNWCPECNTVLANEQVEDGNCWRHGKTKVNQKELSQWYFKITAYAQELLDDLEKLKGYWPEQVISMQKNWIGKSVGTEVIFDLEYMNKNYPISVFTTRVDTLYGVTYVVLAPEHPLVNEIVLKEKPELKEQIDEMINEDKISREAQDKEKNGIFTGLMVKNPVNDKLVPLYIANYVLMDYGTGAVMAVPAHDDRDFDFSLKYNLEQIEVIRANNEEYIFDGKKAFLGKGKMVNSAEFDGMSNVEAVDKIIEKLENMNKGKKTVNYRLHDWLISRQRYWGTPIPVIYDEDGNIYLDEDLPVKLPTDINFTSGGNPIKTSESFKNVKLKNGKMGTRETDTMDTFVDSSWYYLRYLDPQNTKRAFGLDKAKAFKQVDQYIGGIEHAVLHLLYARFIHKVYRDLGYVVTDEPFKSLLTQGMVLNNSYYSSEKKKFLFKNEVKIEGNEAYAKDGNEKLTVKLEKMSKSKNNGVSVDDIINEYGADASRLFSLFAAPPEKELEWNENGLQGCYRFLNRIFLLVSENIDILNKKYDDIILSNRTDKDQNLQMKTHQTIKKVTQSMEDNYHFNTAIASIMELLNDISTYKQEIIDKNMQASESNKVFKEAITSIVIMISPFAPHISEQLWEMLNNKEYVFNAKWPEYVEELTISSDVNIAIQVNGKLKSTISVKRNSEKEIVLEKAKTAISNLLENKEIIKEIYIENRLVNIVIK